jgi:hypothetical protein
VDRGLIGARETGVDLYRSLVTVRLQARQWIAGSYFPLGFNSRPAALQALIGAQPMNCWGKESKL